MLASPVESLQGPMSIDVRFHSDRSLFASERFRLLLERFDTPDGRVERPVIHHPGAVGVIARPDDEQLLLVRQFRYPTRSWTLEVPAGTRAPGEDPARCAARELQEEAGVRAGELVERLRCYPAIGVSDEELILFEARRLEPAAVAPEHGELVAPETVAIAELPALRRQGLICDAKTLLALALIGSFPDRVAGAAC